MCDNPQRIMVYNQNQVRILTFEFGVKISSNSPIPEVQVSQIIKISYISKSRHKVPLTIKSFFVIAIVTARIGSDPHTSVILYQNLLHNHKRSLCDCDSLRLLRPRFFMLMRHSFVRSRFKKFLSTHYCLQSQDLASYHNALLCTRQPAFGTNSRTQIDFQGPYSNPQVEIFYQLKQINSCRQYRTSC